MLQYYHKGMKARVSPVQSIEPHRILAPTWDLNKGPSGPESRVVTTILPLHTTELQCVYCKSWMIVLQYIRLYCSISDCTAVYPIELQYIRLYCSISDWTAGYPIVLQYIRLNCSISDCTAVYPIVLQYIRLYCSISDCTAVYPIVLQYIRLYCSISDCTAVYPIVLARVCWNKRSIHGLHRVPMASMVRCQACFRGKLSRCTCTFSLRIFTANDSGKLKILLSVQW